VSKKYEMALVNLESYYSFPNITAKNNNFRYKSGPENNPWVDINIPEGCYELADINDYIQRTMKEKGHYDAANDEYCITIQPNSNTLKSVLTITPGYFVDFLEPDNSIRSDLGFRPWVYAEGYNESEQIVNIVSKQFEGY